MSETQSPNCKHCGSSHTRKNGILKPSKKSPDRPPIQRYRCYECGRSFTDIDVPRYSGDGKVSQYESTKRWRAKVRAKDIESE